MGTDIKEDRIRILELEDGGTTYINWFEEGGGKVVRENRTYHLFECGAYDGGEHLSGDYCVEEIDKMLETAYSWT